MFSFLVLRQKYYCPLPPTELLQLLEQVITPPDTPSFLFRQPHCVGTVDKTQQTFAAWMPSRSITPSLEGRWLSNATMTETAGTIVELVARNAWADLLPVVFLGPLALAAALVALLSNYFLAAIGIVAFGLVITAIPWLELHRTHRYFEQSLPLTRLKQF